MNRCFKDRSLQSYNLQKKTIEELTLINRFTFRQPCGAQDIIKPRAQGNIKIGMGRLQLDQTERNSETQWMTGNELAV